jgi:hypothetical protein
MGVSIHEASVPVFVRMLGNLRGILQKAQAHAEACKVDPAVLLGSRLFPDMYPLARQVVIAADAAADAGASLAQVPLPAWTNDEASFAGLEARLRATIAFLESLDPARFGGAEERPVSWTARGATVTVKGAAYLLNHAMPKFYFHLTTAYAILRKDGVALKKGDFMGKA